MAGGLAEHAGEFARDQGDFVAQAVGGLDVMKDAHGGAAREAEGQQPPARVEGESFRAINADQRRQAAQLPGYIWRLALKLGGVRLGFVCVAEHLAAMQADAGA